MKNKFLRILIILLLSYSSIILIASMFFDLHKSVSASAYLTIGVVIALLSFKRKNSEIE